MLDAFKNRESAPRPRAFVAGLALATTALTAAACSDSEYRQSIEACAGALAGEDVELQDAPPDEGGYLVPEELLEEVGACQRADGDVELAELFLDQRRSLNEPTPQS